MDLKFAASLANAKAFVKMFAKTIQHHFANIDRTADEKNGERKHNADYF